MEQSSALQQHFSDVMYASVERSESHSKLLSFDDRGVLDFTKTGFIFRGKAKIIQAERIIVTEITRQQIPWRRILPTTIIGCIATVVILFFFNNALQNTSFILVMSSIYSLAIIGAATLTVIFTHHSLWVRVKYKDSIGGIGEALLAVRNPTSGFSSKDDTYKIFTLLNEMGRQI